MFRNTIHIVLVAVVAVLTVACGSTTPAIDRPVTEPMIDTPGEHIVRYRGPQLETVVSTRYASTRIGEDWLILQVALSGMESAATEVRRDAVSLRLPDGNRIPIMSHEEFKRHYDEIAGPARQAAIASEPLSFTRANRRPCSLSFMPLPNTGVVLEARNVTKNELCQGFLYFKVPGGVQPGPYELEIELEEGDVEVPFRLP
jgi:hypothetical protein